MTLHQDTVEKETLPSAAVWTLQAYMPGCPAGLPGWKPRRIRHLPACRQVRNLTRMFWEHHNKPSGTRIRLWGFQGAVPSEMEWGERIPWPEIPLMPESVPLKKIWVHRPGNMGACHPAQLQLRHHIQSIGWQRGKEAWIPGELCGSFQNLQGFPADPWRQDGNGCGGPDRPEYRSHQARKNLCPPASVQASHQFLLPELKPGRNLHKPYYTPLGGWKHLFWKKALSSVCHALFLPAMRLYTSAIPVPSLFWYRFLY